MPDLGKYADTVLSAYGVSLLLLLALLVMTLMRGAKVRADLKQVEERMRRNG
ncbi:Heme exporter protein D (CcmD) [Tritonibacter mobilis]|uniref:Heme exporter protein D n=1 Tax=Tritonibacter mobilis F1926 TaxID=1265309 RepID=A0A1B1A2M8_9RHOB|nr:MULTISPECIES: heme exporter protein CcmD [Rhodobacterales]EEW56852.1 heme exporter protein CcmD [Ruegeria sp. TrichCH4B]MBW3242330.1 heme exporter protein CcmD [Epibacterium sp. DP7N7-1]MCZ4268323.1 heme exporter protein CcmD [Rhodobacteraceae bacterium G21628-S1]NKX28463.1 heme exporter protein CcmD [Rhodobacteraceae bacterium R_SAG6]PXW82969.1 heme exporter protein D [Ruegeria sp. P4]